MILENEFYEILNQFKLESRSLSSQFKSHPISFSITGTPLRKSHSLIVGNNWGGNMDIPSQKSMPLVNDILVDQSSPTYRGYFDFFKTVFSDDLDLTLSFLNSIVLTNGCLIRTPNQEKNYLDLIKKGFEISRKYLVKLIEIIEPEIIMCFGIGNYSATSQLVKIFGRSEKYWDDKDKDIEIHRTSNGWSTFYFIDELCQKKYKIFSFPHISRYNFWKNKINQNKNFQLLVDELTTCYKINT